jgi:hypothetical protein
LHRYYDPTLGRYVSADPIGQFGVLVANRVEPPALAFSLAISNRLVLEVPFDEHLVETLARENVYAYAGSRPTGVIDPLGLQGDDTGIFPVDLSPQTRAAFATGSAADPKVREPLCQSGWVGCRADLPDDSTPQQQRFCDQCKQKCRNGKALPTSKPTPPNPTNPVGNFTGSTSTNGRSVVRLPAK